MRIALCSYSQKEKETALLMKLGKVDRFDNGVFCTYAMQRDGPYDAVVVMEDGARGMNFCMSSYRSNLFSSYLSVDSLPNHFMQRTLLFSLQSSPFLF